MPSEGLADYEDGEPDGIFVVSGGDPLWSGWSDILHHGMGSHHGRGNGGRIQLERTGPYVPPITFPGIGVIVVTDKMKETMESAGFRGVTFKPVIKAHIVDIPWQTWDSDADEPPYYPDDGESAGYILDKPHSPEVADAMGDLWEVVLKRGAEMERIQVGEKRWEVEFKYVPNSWNGSDLFYAKGNRHKYASPRAKRWFEEHFSEWTSFKSGVKH